MMMCKFIEMSCTFRFGGPAHSLLVERTARLYTEDGQVDTYIWDDQNVKKTKNEHVVRRTYTLYEEGSPRLSSSAPRSSDAYGHYLRIF